MRRTPLPIAIVCAIFPFLQGGCGGWRAPESFPTSEPGIARGRVFEDRNQNGRLDSGERGVAGVRVSNGHEIVRSDARGHYAISIDDDSIVFVIKPRDMRTVFDDRNLPRFYYIHKPAGSPDAMIFPGVPETGPLPASINFPLVRQEEGERFRVLVFGDPQPDDRRELGYFERDILSELAETDAAFGFSLGDLVNDDLSLLDPYTRAVALLGLPWYNIIGNHDINYDAVSDRFSDETFERVFGPGTYAFEYGPVHFIVLDNVIYFPASSDGNSEPSYQGGLHPEQLEFIRNYVADVPTDERIVLLMHIPLVGLDSRPIPQSRQLFEILARHPHTLSISAHTHMQSHYFLGEAEGNPGPVHHHWISATTSGSWWMGTPDERGIPHSQMRDGTPNGYSIVSFDGSDYSIRFKAAGRPATHQMNIHAPEQIESGDSRPATVWVNVFAGSEHSRVEMRVVPTGSGGATPWVELERKATGDPFYQALFEREERLREIRGTSLPGPAVSRHLWRGSLPVGLAAGSYWIEVRSKDLFDQLDRERRVLHVEPTRTR